MKLRLFLIAALPLLLLALGQPAHGQAILASPAYIDYQGKALDSSGNPLAPSTPANYTVIFRIYSAQTGGTSLWTEQQTVTISNGLFSVQLGAGTQYLSEPHGNLSTTAFQNSQATTTSMRYVGATVVIPPATAANAGEITPRLAVLPSPFAYCADHASTADSVTGVVTATAGSTFAGTIAATGSSTFAGVVTAATGSTFTGTVNAATGSTFNGTVNAAAGSTFAGGTLTGTYTGGTFTGGTFSGNGSGLTNFTASQIPGLDASKITTGILPLANGGTGSSTQNFVDLSNAQNIGGAKTHTASLTISQSNGELTLNDGSTTRGEIAMAAAAGNYSGSSAAGDVVIRATAGNKLLLQSGTNAAALAIGSNNYVGIGTNAPIYPLHVVGSAKTPSITYGYFLYGASQLNYGPAVLSCSIFASNSVVCSELDVPSDVRLKTVHGLSDGTADLATLLAIKITDYHFKDVVSKGALPQKKVIAQQVEEVFPQAVKRTVGVVPDIYRKASYENGWILLDADLRAGERVRLLDYAADDIFEVLETQPGRFRTAFKPKGDELFVYGREVADLRAVDYDAIAMLNVSATQQIKKEKDAEIRALKEENAALQKRLAAVESKDAEREARLAKLEQALARLASGAPAADHAQPGEATAVLSAQR